MQTSLTGPAVQKEGARIAFYTNGTAEVRIPASGTVSVEAWGTEADGRGPRFTVQPPGMSVVEVEATLSPSMFPLGPFEAGQTLRLVYEDDTQDASGADRNLFVERLIVVP